MTLGSRLDRAHLRLRRLYEISKLLTRFEGVEKTLPDVVAVAAKALPVRSAVLLLAVDDNVDSYVWKTDDATTAEMAGVLAHARSTHAYLTGRAPMVPSSVDVDEAPTSILGLPYLARGTTGEREERRFIVLPLVVERRRVFGALQFEGAAPLDETDLVFVNAVANQVAVAIDRQSKADEARAITEGARGAAVEAELRARAQLDLTRALTGSLGEGVLAVDAEGRVTFLNPAAEELLGTTEERARGRHAPEVFRVRRGDGSVLEDSASPLLLALRSGRSRRSDDYLFVGHAGVAVPMSYTANAMRSAGAVIGAVLAFRDVLAVKRSERMQRFLAQISAALGASLDQKHTFAALARYSVPSFADICFVDAMSLSGELTRVETRFADPRKRATAAAHLPVHDASVDPTSTYPLLVEDLSSDGAIRARDGLLLRELGATSMLVLSLIARGRTFGLLTFALAESGRRYSRGDLVFAQEIAHRAATALDNAHLHQRAQEAVRQRQDILAMVSHDLRAPLNTILLATSTLIVQTAPPADRSRLEMIRRAAQRMVRMTTDLLDLSSIEAGRLSVAKVPTSIRDLFDAVVESQDQAFVARSVRLEARSQPDLVAACDRDRVLQVLTNLLSNAVKFTPAGGSVTMMAERRGDDVYCQVANTGPAIAKDVLPHLFARYLQAPETAALGRGLGLFITKGIIEAHGGTVGVRSDEAEGTTFFFTLPG